MQKWEIDGVDRTGLPIRLSGDSTDPISLNDGLYRFVSKVPLELIGEARTILLNPGGGSMAIGLTSRFG